MTPLRLFVDGGVGDAAQGANQLAVLANSKRRNARAGRLVHKGHELVRESRHGAANTDPADIRASADAAHPATLGDVAVHHRTPAAELHKALGRSVLQREVALLVVAGAIATLMHGLAEQPGWPQLSSSGIIGRQACDLVEQVQHGLHEVVGLHRTSRHIDDGQSCFGPPSPAQVVSQAHASGGIAGHGVNAAISSACASADDRERLWSQTINPLAGGDGLSGF